LAPGKLPEVLGQNVTGWPGPREPRTRAQTAPDRANENFHDADDERAPQGETSNAIFQPFAGLELPS